jgi:hypothetical protein
MPIMKTGFVTKLLRSNSNKVEQIEIVFEAEAGPLRIDNALIDSEGRTVALSVGARVTLTVEATPHAPAD